MGLIVATQDRIDVATDVPAVRSEGPELRLLGGFALEDANGRVELPHSAQRLVAFLALQGRPLRRLYVAGRLWAEASERQARASLRSVLWRLGATASIVDATGGHLALVPSVTVDVATWQSCAERVLHAPSPDRSDLAAVGAQDDLLPDWYDDWLIVERERIRQRRLHTLERTCRRLTELRRHAEAIDAGLAAVEIDVLRETGHRVVIEAHLAEGNLIEASRQYELLRDLLREHLGIRPSDALRAVLRDAHVTPS